MPMQGFDQNEWRIAEIRQHLHDLRIAAENNELNDATTNELANLAELGVETWKRALGMMANRWEQRTPTRNAFDPLAFTDEQS